MKTLILLISVSFAINSYANGVQLLSVKEFRRLNREEQVIYLKGLQKILVSMTRKTPYMADESKNNVRLPANSWTAEEYSKYLGEVDDDESITTALADTTRASTSSPTKTSASTSNSNSTPVPQPSTSASAPAQPVSSTLSVEETLDPDETLVTNALELAKERARNRVTTSAVPVRSQSGAVIALDDAVYDKNRPMPGFPATTAKQKKPSPSKSTAKAASQVATVNLIEPESEHQSPTKKDANPKTTSTKGYYRCMYAGWVVEQDPCLPPEALPDWMSFDGMSSANKTCQSGSAACNPVLFGLKLPPGCNSFSECPEKATPFCVPKRFDATEMCYKEASKGDSKGTRIAAELNDTIKPQNYERFQKMFQDLCDEEKIKTNPFADFRDGKPRSQAERKRARADITKTCNWAAKQVKDLNDFVTAKNTTQPKKDVDKTDARR